MHSDKTINCNPEMCIVKNYTAGFPLELYILSAISMFITAILSCWLISYWSELYKYRRLLYNFYVANEQLNRIVIDLTNRIDEMTSIRVIEGDTEQH